VFDSASGLVVPGQSSRGAALDPALRVVALARPGVEPAVSLAAR